MQLYNCITLQKAKGQINGGSNNMSQKYSLAHLTVLKCAPPELIYIAAMTGYDYVGLRPIYMGLVGEPNYDLANNKEMLKDTKTALKETGIEIHDIELAKIEEGRNVDQYEAAIAVGAELGAKSILSSIWTLDEDFYLEQFSRLCDIAYKYGMNVDLEFVTWANVNDLESAAKVLKTVNKPNAGIMIDTLHFNRSRVELDELDSIPKDWFHFAHICDGPKEIPTDKAGLIHTGRDERFYVGEGGIDIAAILNRLPEEIVYSIELPHLKRVEVLGSAEHARRCLETAKNYLATNKG